MKKLLVLVTILCGAFYTFAAGFDGKTLVTNDWFEAGFTALTVDSEVVLNSTTGIVRGAGSWTAVPASGTAKIVADADAGGEATMLSFEAGDEELEFTPAPLSSPTGMETTSTTVKGGAVSELPTAPGNVQAGFTVYDDGTNAVPYGLTSGGWTNLVYSGAMSGLTNAWYTLTLDFANVANVRYVRYAVTPAGGSRTVLEDSLGETWFPAASNATTITSVAFTGTGDVRSFVGDYLADAVATCNGVNYATVADAIAAAGDGDTVMLLGGVTEGTLTISKNLTLDFNGKQASLEGIVINEGKTLTVTRANSSSNVIPTITGGGSLVVSGNNTFNWRGMVGTSTLASITQDNSSGGITISGYGTINVTSNVIVNGTLTFTPSGYSENAEDTHMINLNAASVSAGTLNGAAVITTTDGVAANAGSFSGTIAGAGGLSSGTSTGLTLAGLNTFAGAISVAENGRLTVSSSTDGISRMFHLDAADEDSILLSSGGHITNWISQVNGYCFTNDDSGVTITTDYFGGKRAVLTNNDKLNSSFTVSSTRFGQSIIAAVRLVEAGSSGGSMIFGANGPNNYYIGRRGTGSAQASWKKMVGSGKENTHGFWQSGVYGDRTYHTDKERTLTVLGFSRNSEMKTEYVGGPASDIAIAELIGFDRTNPDIATIKRIEAYLATKWGMTDMGTHLPSADVTIADGGILDLGGTTQTVASVTGGGTVQNGLLLTTDNVYTNTGALTIPAVHEMTVVLDAGASALTLVGDATNVSVTATDAFIESGATITITALGIHDAGHTIDFSGIPSDIFRFGYNDNGDGTWTLGAQTSGFTAATYVWSPTGESTDWTSLVNWKVGGKAVAVLPQNVDTVKIVETAEIQLSGTVSISNLTLNAQATFSGDQIMNVSEIEGTGLLRMNGIQIRNKNSVTLDFSNNVEVVAGSASNEFSVVTDNKNNSRDINLRGNLTGNGYLTLRSRHSNNYYGVHLYGDNSAFAGTIYVYPYISDGKTERNNTTIESESASSSNAVWNVYNSGAHSFVHNGATAYFGALNGKVNQLDSNNNAKPTLEIGALPGLTSTLGGIYSRTGADRRSGEGAIIRKVGASSTLVFSGTRTKQYQVNAGLFVLAGAADSDNITPVDGIIFGGGTLAVASSNIVDDAVVFADPSSAIKNSTAPICFSNAVDEVHTWATALADSNTGGLVKKGEGTLVLKEVPYYTGDTYLRGGTLKLPTSAGVKVKTDVVGKRITGRRETIEGVQYIVYELIDIQPGTVIRLI